MRNFISAAIAAFVVCCVCFEAFSQEPGGPPEGRGRGGRFRQFEERGRGFGGPGMEGRRGPMRMNPLIVALDADGNGEISAAEIENAVAVLKGLDQNKDGKLTREELMPSPEERGGPGGGDEAMVTRLMQFDRNEDGKLSKEELPARIQQMFDRADTDQDGFATREELQALAARRTEASEGRRPGGGFGERGDRGRGGREGFGGRRFRGGEPENAPEDEE